MKRFFKPIEKDGPAKKPSLSSSKEEEGETTEIAEDKSKKEPVKFLTWNANSLLLRVKNDWPEFSKLVSNIDPDVIAIQEVRMPAAGSKGAPKNPGELKDDTSSSREEKQDCGQPGFTSSERRRFGAILKEGKLVDAYRFLHKDKDMDCGFSWSGHPIGKYRGKRMRIDYFVVSEQIKDRIVACEMHGKGIELEGFYGSDHCPVSLQLSPASPDSS